jgi:hypothetical protein
MKCGGNNAKSEHLQNIKDSNSAGDACCGYLLFGPIGLLCGFGKVSSENKMYWICQDCGYKWQDRKEHIEDLKKAKSSAIIILISIKTIVNGFNG